MKEMMRGNTMEKRWGDEGKDEKYEKYGLTLLPPPPKKIRNKIRTE